MPDNSEKIKEQVIERSRQTTPKSIKYVDAPTYSSFYCNNIGFAVNQLDIVLVLGELIEVSPEAEATVERKSRVTMNPGQAKAMSKILDFAVAAYEAQSGHPVDDLPINLPELPAK
ncbi:MAG TPA: DUF3467 domain-containing protein [Terracidiphilus sp.]|jgi:hypothetical protein